MDDDFLPKINEDEPEITISNKSRELELSTSSLELRRLYERYNNREGIKDEDIIKREIINPDFTKDLLLVNLKIAENAMLNSLNIVATIERLINELQRRLENPSALRDDQLIHKLGILFEISERYQSLIQKVLEDENYKYYLDSLSATRRALESYKIKSKALREEESNLIGDSEVDRRLVYEVINDFRKAFKQGSSTNEIHQEVEEVEIE